VNRVEDIQIPTVPSSAVLHTTDTDAIDTTDTIEPHINDNRIDEEYVETPVATLPHKSTPTQTIDQILFDTPAPTEQEAAEALGELAYTTVKQSTTEERRRNQRNVKVRRRRQVCRRQR
jgi:hypothetical protein